MKLKTQVAFHQPLGRIVVNHFRHHGPVQDVNEYVSTSDDVVLVPLVAFLILANDGQAGRLGSYGCFTARIRVRRLPATNGKHDRKAARMGSRLAYARSLGTTLPATSVNRKFRPK